MGLDAVELIMGVEEAFDIEIPDHEAEKLSTVGQLYAFVVGRLAFQSRRCPSSALFYRTRRALIDLYAVPRRHISPSTPLGAVLPSRQRRAHWQTLSQAMELQLPNLELPRWMNWLSNRLGLALLFTGLAAYFVYPVTIAVLYTLAGALLVWAANRLAAPFAVRIPAECATVGGTVRAILRSEGYARTQTRRKWDPNDVWETLRKVIAEQFDVPPETITAETDFVYDLGAD